MERGEEGTVSLVRRKNRHHSNRVAPSARFFCFERDHFDISGEGNGQIRFEQNARWKRLGFVLKG